MAKLEIKNTVNEEKYIDPVCGMEITLIEPTLESTYEGSNYWFCAKACRDAFEKNPKKYLKPKKPKGIWGRYLDRLNKSTEGKPLKCH